MYESFKSAVHYEPGDMVITGVMFLTSMNPQLNLHMIQQC